MKLTRRNFLELTGAAALATVSRSLGFSQSSKGTNGKIRVAYPPTMAALPLVKGTQESFFLSESESSAFSKNGLEVSLLPSKSPSDGARLVSGGKADCSITDLASAIYGVQGTGNLKVLSTAFDPNEMVRYNGLLTSNLYDISSIGDLIESWLDKSGKNSIVLSKRRDEHYSTDELIKSSGLKVEDSVYYLDGEDLISRMTGLLNGNYVSAVLPEPLLTIALENPQFEGYQANLLETYKDVVKPPFVFVFNQKFLNRSPELVEKFYKSWNNAIEETNNSNKLQLLSLTTEIITGTFPSLKKPIEGTEFTEEFANLFEVPDFSAPAALNESIYDSVLDWTIAKGYLSSRVDFDRVFGEHPSVLSNSK